MIDLTPDQLLERLNWRYAVKSFDPDRKIPDDAWAAIEQSLLLAPSSFGLQPWKFLVVDDKGLRQQLKEASWNQSQVADADRYVVITALRTTTEDDVDRYIERQCAVRGEGCSACGIRPPGRGLSPREAAQLNSSKPASKTITSTTAAIPTTPRTRGSTPGIDIPAAPACWSICRRSTTSVG